MYCPSCGTLLTPGLSYCNRCGANQSVNKGSAADESPEKAALLMVWAIVGVTLSMAAIMLGAMPVMKTIGLSEGAILIFVGLLFLTMLAVDGILTWQLFRLGSRGKESRGALHVGSLDTSDFDLKREQPLLEPRMSVTENTTRNFEPVYDERRNNE
ncbi:MAG: hypothetical protein AABO41_11165 [Acidobacteriota bacterium]